MIKLSEIETHLVKIRKKNTELHVKCDQCDYTTDNVSNLVKHILSHEAFEDFQYCDFVVKDKKDLKDHEIMVIT